MSIASSAPPRRLAVSATLVALLLLALLFASRLLPHKGGGFVEYPMLVRTDIPAAIAIGKQDEVWFTMDFSDSIGLLREGKIKRLPIGNRSVEPIGLAVDRAGDAWYADQVARTISRISPSGEVKRYPLGMPIARMGRVAVGPDGSIWFAEGTAYSITRLLNEKFERYVIESARGGPYGIAVDQEGNVWATLQHANQIVHVSAKGEMDWHWVPTPASAPSDIALDSDGGVWFLEVRNNSIGHLKNGEFKEYRVPSAREAQISGLAGLAVGSDRAVWFGMLREHALGRLHDGEIAKFALPRQDARPCGVAIDSKGNIWYADISGYVGMLSAERARVS